MEKKHTALAQLLEWVIEFEDKPVKPTLTNMKEKIWQLLPTERKQMIGFAHYLRNGLTNIEYCQKEHEEHLEYWCQNYR